MQTYWRTPGSRDFEFCEPGQRVVMLFKDGKSELRNWTGTDLADVVAWLPVPKVQVKVELVPDGPVMRNNETKVRNGSTVSNPRGG